MAESGKNCVECGRPVAMLSGLTINGAAYHSHCWDTGRRLIPKAGKAPGWHGPICAKPVIPNLLASPAQDDRADPSHGAGETVPARSGSRRAARCETTTARKHRIPTASLQVPGKISSSEPASSSARSQRRVGARK